MTCLLATVLIMPIGEVHAASDSAQEPHAEKIAPDVWRKVQSGQVRELLVLFETDSIERLLESELRQRSLKKEDKVAIALRASHYRELKNRALSTLPAGDMEVRRNFRHVPMAYISFRDVTAIRRLLAHGDVAAVYENTRLYPHLAEILPLTGQTLVNSVMGRNGSGTAVVVLDTGVNYSLSEFGSCTSPGMPGSCRVPVAFDAAPDDGSLDANGHGTWVAGTAAAIAPGTKIISIDVFDGESASSVDIIEGIDWVIDNRAAYNIVAINLSLGDGEKHTSPCSSKFSNPYRQPIIDARNAGILSIVSSGNDGFIDGIANPACTPEAVSVGATYDANVGSRTWTSPEPDCTDSTTQADKVACFSNSASFLTLLAPGALTTVTGVTAAGTSLSSPVVSGAVAVLAQAFPGDTATARLNRLTANGKSVTDSRNGLVKPRVDLLAAQGEPANNAFALASVLTGSSGSVTGWNLNATLEQGEPSHAGSSGGKSVWWQWTPSTSGMAVFNTHGSGFDTLLAVYTGNGVSLLSAVVSNDNDGSAGNTSGLSFSAEAGTTYRIAVDGNAGTSGLVNLAWSLLQSQTINFGGLSDRVLDESPVTIFASASSSLPVVFSSLTPSVCMVSGDNVTLLSTGTCSIAADQSGNATYAPAAQEVRSFSVLLGQSISFAPLAGRALGSGSFALSATASSGLAVVFSSVTPAVCTVSGTTVTLVAIGTCSIAADQPGNATYAAAPTVVQSFSVTGAVAEDGDVPLPPWALGLLGAALLGGISRKRGKARV